MLENIADLKQITIHFESFDKQFITSKTLSISTDKYNGHLVHYIRNDNQYKGSDYTREFWTYGLNQTPCVANFNFITDFGMCSVVNNSNVIVRKKTWGQFWSNDWAEQTISFSLDQKTNNYYIIDDNDKIYTTLADVIINTNPRILFAVMDNKDSINVYLSHPAPLDTKFMLYINHTLQKNTLIEFNEDRTNFKLILQNIQIIANDLIEIRASNTFIRHKVLLRNYLDNYYYPSSDMGIVFDNLHIHLRLFAPTANSVEILIYDNWDIDKNSYMDKQSLIYDATTGTYSTKLKRNQYEYKYYLYRLSFTEIDLAGNTYTRTTYVVDPYAAGIAVNSSRGVLLDLNAPELTPIGWMQDCSPKLKKIEDTILYEMHIRDFTINSNSRVTKNTNGKYVAAGEAGCGYIDEKTGTRVMTGLDHLIELGITHVHLLPIADFGSIDESNITSLERNWGYDPEHFNCPEGSYATNPFDPITRIKELRQMIHNFHKNGLRVVMDVVYNHMFNTKTLDDIIPKYYFRSNYIGKFTNGSGCGNELATERPMVRKFILDSVKHWILNYKIDGLRFDLMELIDYTTIKEIVKQVKDIDSNFLIYGEPWRAGDTPLTTGTYRGSQKNQNFAIFNDVFRDAIRGTNYPSAGFINGSQHDSKTTDLIIDGLKGSIYSLTSFAHESINYVDSHDNYTLWDQIEKSQFPTLENGNYQQNIPDDIFSNYLVRQNSLALGIILTSLGIPFIHGGSEMLRTKQGDHNSYKSNDLINGFNWFNKLTYKAFFNYIKGLINIRKHHPAFKMTEKNMIENHLHTYPAHNNTSGVIINHFKNHANGDKWKDILIIYNATSIDQYDINDFIPKLSTGKWKLVVNHEKAGINTIASYIDGHIPKLRSHSMMIIHS